MPESAVTTPSYTTPWDTIDLELTIKAHIDATNADPKPFRWTKTAYDILASIQRFCLRTL